MGWGPLVGGSGTRSRALRTVPVGPGCAGVSRYEEDGGWRLGRAATEERERERESERESLHSDRRPGLAPLAKKEFFFLSSEKSKQAGDFFLLFLSLVVLFLLLRSGSRRCVLDPRLFFEASAVVLGRLQTDQRKTKTKSTHGCPVFLHSFCTSRSVRSRPIVTASKERPSPPTRSTSSVS